MTPQERIEELQGYAYPKRAELHEEVDMVMKGGITSGIVYPLAVCQMAKTRVFKSVGGSSAGGIAAAMAAAAEMGRDAGGFNELARLPDDLGRDLRFMFQPSRGTRPFFRILMANMEKDRGKVVRAMRLVGGVIAAAPLIFSGTLAAGIVLGLWAMLVVAGPPHQGADWARLALGVCLEAVPALGLAVGAALAGAALSAKDRLGANGYGLCISSAGQAWPADAPTEPHVEPFTDWLHVRLNRAAKADDERRHVLTFGDLWGAPSGTATRPPGSDVRLEMMTTNITFCRPVGLPNESKLYLYCPHELAAYFPPPVMDHLRAASAAPGNVRCPDHAGEVLVPLPCAGDLPVILAVRLTLSFPGLISAVPLYAVDYGPEAAAPVRCWFSDGGISSNFPIHLFDALWPGRPTFGISLGPYPVGRPRQPVYFRGHGRAAVPRVRDTTSLTGFVGALVDTLQNWSDEAQSTLPGYRDRIVEVHTDDDEGGMNFIMSSDTVRSMCVRGYEAAVRLDEFEFDRHRDVRYRTAMAQLDRAGRDMLGKYDDELPGGFAGYRDFIQNLPFARATGPFRSAALERTDTLLTFVGRDAGDDGAHESVPLPDFTAEGVEPRPTPDLRIVAHL